MTSPSYADERSRQAVVDYPYQWSPVTNAASVCARSAADVSLSTVRDFEKGRRVPIGNNLSAIKGALEARGILFTERGITGPA